MAKAGETRALSIQAREAALETLRAMCPRGTRVYTLAEHSKQSTTFWVRLFVVATPPGASEPELEEITSRVRAAGIITSWRETRGMLQLPGGSPQDVVEAVSRALYGGFLSLRHRSI